MADYLKQYELWSTDSYFSEKTRNELTEIKDDVNRCDAALPQLVGVGILEAESIHQRL